MFSVDSHQTAIGTVMATDADGDSVTFYVFEDEFAITQAGVLTFVSAPDYQTKASHTATVTASDGTNSSTQAITVNVVPTTAAGGWQENTESDGFTYTDVQENGENNEIYKFTYETTGNNGDGSIPWQHNKELQGYDKNHARLNGDSELEIFLKAYPASTTDGDNDTFIFKSARLIMTEDKDKLKLEKDTQISVEFEGKMPTAYHTDNVDTLDNFPLWPAFWLMGSEFWKEESDERAVWPSCSEIDVLEWEPIKGIDKYSNAIHWDTTVEWVTDPC